jgi:hypothetical protein
VGAGRVLCVQGNPPYTRDYSFFLIQYYCPRRLWFPYSVVCYLKKKDTALLYTYQIPSPQDKSLAIPMDHSPGTCWLFHEMVS